MPYYDDPQVFYDAEGVFYDDPGLGYATGDLPLNQPLPSLGSSHMEYWEITKERAQATLPHLAGQSRPSPCRGKTPADLDALINGFEPAAQARTAAQDVFDAAERVAQTSLLKMKILGTKVPSIIDAQLSENAAIQKDLQDVFRAAPRTESGILARMRSVIPVWERANTALAAMTPAGAPSRGRSRACRTRWRWRRRCSMATRRSSRRRRTRRSCSTPRAARSACSTARRRPSARRTRR